MCETKQWGEKEPCPVFDTMQLFKMSRGSVELLCIRKGVGHNSQKRGTILSNHVNPFMVLCTKRKGAFILLCWF